MSKFAAAVAFAFLAAPAFAQDVPSTVFEPIDVFALEYADDPQMSPDGRTVVYARTSGDIMTDRFRSSIWTINADGTEHRPLVEGTGSYTSPRISPDAARLAYVAVEDGAAEVRLRWFDTGQTATLARLPGGPSNLVWSPDGTTLAFTLFVPEEGPAPAPLPAMPAGAEWAAPAKVVDATLYRADGAGFLPPGHQHVFTLTADGGTPRRLTFGAQNNGGGLCFTPDGTALVYSSNHAEDADLDQIESEIYALDLETGGVAQLTHRDGPDGAPAVSPGGDLIAYTGFDDAKQGYQVSRLYMMNRDGSNPHVVTAALDRSVAAPVWAPDGRSIYALYDDQGDTKLAQIGLDGVVRVAAEHVGGTTLGRPYSSGDFAVGPNGRFVVTTTSTERPSDLAVGDRRGSSPLTHLNDDLLGYKTMGGVEEIEVASSHDQRPIQAWIVFPPNFDPEATYPLLLEIHGGPFANYGPRFSAEIQLYAAAGYIVVYANPRGSTSYGGAFGNLIHHAYPSEDYDDLMSVVDSVSARAYIDPHRLFVTGGSGGGTLTAWIVGKTDRFRAAVVAKPVINWTSFVLTSDFYPYFVRYWFPGPPWEHERTYWARSPLSLVGNVSTPTMLVTGESDYRTPISETEQFYQALKLREIPTRMVRIPDAGHGIAARPSQLLAKVENIMAWFDEHDAEAASDE